MLLSAMDALWLISVATWVSFFGVAIVPFYIAYRSKIQPLRILSMLLGLFAVAHGIYHLSFDISQSYLGDVVFEPMSVIFLLAFGLYYSKKGLP